MSQAITIIFAIVNPPRLPSEASALNTLIQIFLMQRNSFCVCFMVIFRGCVLDSGITPLFLIV